jgi:hypothetical protein
MTSDLLKGLGIAASAADVAMGLIFLTAGAKKLRHWQEFRGVVAAYRLLPASGAALVAVLIPPIELLLGIASIVRWGMPLTSFAVAAMLSVFAVAMAINIGRGRTAIDCGCFQSALRQELEWRLVIRNVACALLVLAASAVPGTLDATRVLLAFPAGVTLFCLYLALNGVWALDVSRRLALGRS